MPLFLSEDTCCTRKIVSSSHLFLQLSLCSSGCPIRLPPGWSCPHGSFEGANLFTLCLTRSMNDGHPYWWGKGGWGLPPRVHKLCLLGWAERNFRVYVNIFSLTSSYALKKFNGINSFKSFIYMEQGNLILLEMELSNGERVGISEQPPYKPSPTSSIIKCYRVCHMCICIWNRFYLL